MPSHRSAKNRSMLAMDGGCAVTILADWNSPTHGQSSQRPQYRASARPIAPGTPKRRLVAICHVTSVASGSKAGSPAAALSRSRRRGESADSRDESASTAATVKGSRRASPVARVSVARAISAPASNHRLSRNARKVPSASSRKSDSVLGTGEKQPHGEEREEEQCAPCDSLTHVALDEQPQQGEDAQTGCVGDDQPRPFGAAARQRREDVLQQRE